MARKYKGKMKSDCEKYVCGKRGEGEKENEHLEKGMKNIGEMERKEVCTKQGKKIKYVRHGL